MTLATMNSALRPGTPVNPGRETRQPQAKVRIEIVALPIAIVATYFFRADSFATSMGPDELSLLVMAKSIIDGAFPYEVYWDVRAPLAYFLALPSSLFDDAFAALATLRLLTVFVQAGATWTFFCLFRRTLGIPGAAIGSLVLLVSINMTDLHHLAMPNHFVMGMSLVAFACLVAGFRGCRPCLFASAVLVGALPWVMVQTALMASGLAALALFGSSSLRRSERLVWLSLAALPSVVTVGAFFLWGPFDTFFRTFFLAPFGVIDAGIEKEWWSYWESASQLPSSAPWVFVYLLVLLLGAVWFPGTVKRAPAGSALRYAAFLVVPVTLEYLTIALIRPPAREYFIEAAPAIALFAAIVAARLCHWRLWEMPWVCRQVRPVALRAIAVTCLGVVLALPFDPWELRGGQRPPLPKAYCDTAVYWTKRLDSRQTVLDLSGICGLWILNTRRPLHPPFTYAGNWFRPGVPWVGNAFSGDGSESAAVARLRGALSRESSAGVIVASRSLFTEITEHGWEGFFYDEWRLVWYARVAGHDPPFDILAVLVRADMPEEGLIPSPRVSSVAEPSQR